MKKLVLICIAISFIYIFVGCRIAGKAPEGLIKKDVGELEKEEEFSSSLLIENNNEDEKADTATITQQNISLYFWNKENNKLICETRSIFTSSVNLSINDIIVELLKGPESKDLHPVIPRQTRVIDIDQTDNIVTVNFSEEFLDAEDLLVARTALVNTLTDRQGVKYVKILINGNELTSDGTQEGEPLGVLSKSTNNIDELLATSNRQKDENTVKQVNRELFFRDFRGQYLLSEVRTINVKNGGIARAIIEELIKGPIETSTGLYPVFPQGTQLLDINLIDSEDKDSKVIALYFSKELKDPFLTQTVTSRGDNNSDPQMIKDKVEEMKDKEAVILSSIVYSLSGLNNISGVKIYYQDRNANYIDTPLYSMDLEKPLTTSQFPNKLGRKIKVYFANENATHLVPDYRAMSRENLQIARTIIDELILGPREGTGQKAVMPADISRGDIKVWMDENNTNRVIVDLPAKLDGNKMGSTGTLMTLYAMVNSLTDPANTSNVKEVQFLVEGKVVKTFGNLEFSEPFIRNPAIIQE
ncbi:MAG: GerMN domain-containing protein [Clostridiales bacterium]|nr:GerMN domain-containing protein [Clostridiales bacterium]